MAKAPTRRRHLGEPIGRREYVAIAVSTFAILLAVWWGVTAAGLANPLFLPSPPDVASRLVKQAENGQLWTDTGVSVYRITVGFLLATVMAVPLGCGWAPRCGWRPPSNRSLTSCGTCRSWRSFR